MNDHNYKLNSFLYNKIKDINNIKILEFGVRKGISTKLFVDLAEKNNGEVISVDIDDHSNLLNSDKWKFIHSRDDNFNKIKKEITAKLDVILLDSFHEAEHVSNIIYNYYSHIYSSIWSYCFSFWILIFCDYGNNLSHSKYQL